MKAFVKFQVIFLFFFLGCSKNPDSPIQNGSQKSSLKEITKNPTIAGVSDVIVAYDAVNYVYAITVPSSTNVRSLKLEISISERAKISPDPSLARDYTNPVMYEVTAEDGSKRTYAILIVRKLSEGKKCLVSRIEDVNSKEYFNFLYDSDGRVIQIDSYFALSFSDKPFQAKMTFQYNGSGDVMEAHLTGNLSTIDAEGITYKPIYQNGTLLRVAARNQSGGEGAIKTSVDSQKQLTQVEDPGSVCYAYSYFGGALTRINTCNSVFVNSAMDYAGVVRNFTTSQSSNPAFMCIYADFMKQFDATGLLFQFGLMLPSQRTEFARPNGVVYESCSVSYKVTADGYPVDMLIRQQKKLNTDFPYSNLIHYAISYTNCQ